MPTDTPTKTFTTQAQFDTGAAVNVVQDGPNRLRLDNPGPRREPRVVAVSVNRWPYGGTVVKIDADSGKILAEYLHGTAGSTQQPVAYDVDLNGDVWLTNRDGNSVVKIRLPENGQCVEPQPQRRDRHVTGSGRRAAVDQRR